MVSGGSESPGRGALRILEGRGGFRFEIDHLVQVMSYVFEGESAERLNHRFTKIVSDKNGERY